MSNFGADVGTVRGMLTSALRYWEPRRLLFNGVLAAVVLTCFVLGWPVSRRVLNLDSALVLFVFAVLANLAYCAAYLPDVVLQYSVYRERWMQRRWMLFWLGTLFACAITYLLVSGMFGVGPNANGNCDFSVLQPRPDRGVFQVPSNRSGADVQL
jgi:hypothetical protein